MNKISSTKKLVLLSILVTISIGFSLLDSWISSSIFPTLPGIKIGISNIVIIIAVLNFDFKEGLLITILKSLIAGLLFQGLMPYIIGGCASLVSYIGMYFINKIGKDKISAVTVSLFGGLLHIITQLVIITFIYKTMELALIYGVYIIVSCVTGIFVGIVSIKVNALIQPLLKETEKVDE